MSYVSSLENQNRVYRAQAITPATQAGATLIYVTISNWPSWATFDRLLVAANNAFTNLRVKAVMDQAAYRATSGVAKSALVQDDITDTGSAVSSVRLAMGGAFCEDPRHVGCLYLELSHNSGAAFTTGTVFTLTAEGHAVQPNTRDEADELPFKLDTSWRILQATTSTVNDLTKNLTRNGNPYGLNNPDEGEQFIALSATTDYLYLGSATPFNSFLVLIPSLSAQSTPITAQYWNGAWTSLTLNDNTSDGQPAPSSFTYTGVIGFTAPSDWASQKLAIDPMTTYENDLIAGYKIISVNGVNKVFQVQPIAFYSNPARYWIRLSFATLNPNPLKLTAIQVLR